MSTRGSFEAITCAGVLAVVLACHRQRFDTAAVLFGLVVHLRIYPIMYALPFVYHISYAGDSLGEKAKKEKAVGHRFVDLFSLRCIRFGVISAGTCVALGYFYYARYGYEFLHETYLYHLVRRDTRHNFS